MDEPLSEPGATATAITCEALPAPWPAASATAVPNLRARHREFPAQPAQVAHARHFVRRSLAGCATAHDAALLTSELVTNAILHSRSGHGGTIHVLIWHHCPGVARVAVIDNGSMTTPTVTNPCRLNGAGRGLIIIQELAARWGHDGDEHGRYVWFELHCLATTRQSREPG